MKALVLEEKGKLAIRDVDLNEKLGDDDVRIDIKAVGICGSDIHYYEYGKIGPFIVKEPMILGHEASGIISEVGKNVTRLKPGDRVCMEPGIPDPKSRESRMGMYNLDPSVSFWATPPVHGCLRSEVVHPADFTYKLPEGVSLEEGALVEPLAIGMHAASKAEIRPGDIALVIGAGTIGMVTAMAALAGGCSTVIITDIKQPKLDIAAGFGPVVPVNVQKEDLSGKIKEITGGWGVDIVFEASGSKKAAEGLFNYLRPGGRVVYIGMPIETVALDMVAAQAKEARIDTIFRYAHVYPRALNLMGSGKIDVKPLITETYPFDDAIKAYEYAVSPDDKSIKVQIIFP
ncbi:MAG: NAD(P)-dependent alcohol dehydrogenase [Spirochaetia bacterium]